MHIQITRRNGSTESVSMADAIAKINELSGRVVGSYVIDQAHKNRKRGRPRESAYVAAAKGSEGHPGFDIEVIR